MIVGIAYDLEESLQIAQDLPDDWLEEYDSENTIRAIQEVIEGLGHQVVRLGGGVTFVDRIKQEPVDPVFNLAQGPKGRGAGGPHPRPSPDVRDTIHPFGSVDPGPDP